MQLTLSIQDETTAGARQSAGSFRFETTTVTLRDVIRLRIQQEVERFNKAEVGIFRGLIQPEESERILNGVKPRYASLDWERQYEKAISAFQHHGFLVFIDDRQIMDLDEEIPLSRKTKIAFLKLVPLIGG
jgi:hypothetical protein